MKKIAVMLPIAYRGGTLRAAKNIAKSIAYQAQQRGEEIQVIFSYVRGDYNLYVDFDDLAEYGIILRETIWQVYPKELLQDAINLIDDSERLLQYSTYCLPFDGANDFYDCDLWIIVSDRLPAPLLPIRRYVFIVYDYIQRYVPQIFGNDESVWRNQFFNLLSSVRHAAKVFTTTPSTQQDLVVYAGVPKTRIHLLDMDFQPLEPEKTKIDVSLPKNYILWTTNLVYHKNHINAIDAFAIYSQEFGGSLHLVITGASTDYFDPDNNFPKDDPVINVPQVQQFRKKIKQNPALSKKIHVMSNLSDKMYAHILQNAKFLWHPALYDNGTFAVIEAAYLGIPSLSARYPAMEYINHKFEINMQFFNPHNPKEMAQALLNMETASLKTPLPSKEFLLKHDWKNRSSSLYEAIIELLW